MEVLIVSKTHMANVACVGGLVISNNRYVRLLNPGNFNQPGNTAFEVGDLYDLTFSDRTSIQPPHVEDVVVSSKTLLGRVENMPEFLTQQGVVDWQGPIQQVFDGLLSWTKSKAGYIPYNGLLPKQSVGFWLADQDLIRAPLGMNKVSYLYSNGENYRKITFVGFQKSIPTIPAGTILRVSLSRVFPAEESELSAPRGFYLQLSGWY